MLSFSCAFAGWTRWYYWCIAVYFRFLASKALHYTLYHAEHFSILQIQPWMLMIWTHTQLVCCQFPTFWGQFVPAKILLATGAGAHCQAPCQAPCSQSCHQTSAKPSTKSAATPTAQVAAESAAQLFRVK